MWTSILLAAILTNHQSPVCLLIIQSLPGLIEHFSLSQLSGSEAGGNKEHEHAGDHEVLEVVLDQVKALAGGDPGAVEVETMSKNQDS